jgi:ATP-dependent protease ClpP protease subunit
MPNWGDVLNQISNQQNQFLIQAQQFQNMAVQSIDIVRRQYLTNLHQKTGRNIIAYYSGWLSKPSNILNLDIVDEDKNGFMMAIHNLDKNLPLDLIIHTPGGSIAATESIINYVRKMFPNDIRAIIPQIAMSAGTMMACSCNTILLAKHSNLGPIDPQFGPYPAHGVIQEFRRAYKEIKADVSKAHVWGPILAQYPPTFLSKCENAIKWAESFVQQNLVTHMLKDKGDAAALAKKIVKKLSDYRDNKSHSKHIHFEDCLKMGLKVSLLEEDQELQDLVLTVHHCYMHALMNTAAIKIIENQNGAAFVKQNHQVAAQPRP